MVMIQHVQQAYFKIPVRRVKVSGPPYIIIPGDACMYPSTRTYLNITIFLKIIY